MSGEWAFDSICCLDDLAIRKRVLDVLQLLLFDRHSSTDPGPAGLAWNSTRTVLAKTQSFDFVICSPIAYPYPPHYHRCQRISWRWPGNLPDALRRWGPLHLNFHVCCFHVSCPSLRLFLHLTPTHHHGIHQTERWLTRRQQQWGRCLLAWRPDGSRHQLRGQMGWAAEKTAAVRRAKDPEPTRRGWQGCKISRAGETPATKIRWNVE